MSKYLFVIDLQKQFSDKNGEYEKLVRFINKRGDEYDAIIATIFEQNLEENMNYMKHLHWDGCIPERSEDNSSDSLVENWLDFTPHITIIKNGYGYKHLDKFFDYDDEIHIVGCDIDACVMAICFQLWGRGHTNFKVLTEYCYTTAQNFTKSDVVKILKRNFGDCIQ